MSTAPSWLQNCVIEGLQTLLTLRFRNAPPTDTIEAVVEVWLAVFMTRNSNWIQERDTRRIHQAFMHVAGTTDTWPAPAQIIGALPRIPEPVLIDGPKNPMPEALKAHLRTLRPMFLPKEQPLNKPLTQREIDDYLAKGQRHEATDRT